MSAREHHFQRRLCGMEQLEDRRVMAGLSAVLQNGILSISGTSGNDTISLKQSRNLVQIEGTRLAFATNQVSAIRIEGNGGKDTLRFDRLNVGRAIWSTQITVHQSSGTASVVGTDRSKVYFGNDATLIVDSRGVLTLDGQNADWFDRNIRDQALRDLLRDDFSDQQLSRDEVLDVFDQVRADGSLSRDEFDDLRAVALNNSLFNGVSHVASLVRNVVLGNAANRTYQGVRLGNLAPGKNTAQLDKLVGKWFLGTDHPLARSGNLNFSYTVAAGTLFGEGGPSLADVQQGYVGDCYLVGTFAELAQQSPQDIQNMFIVNGDGTYTVRFLNNGKAEYVTVDSQLPVTSSGDFVYANMGRQASDASNVLWVALAEKAYVQMNESGWLRANRLPGNGLNSYAAIAGGYMSDVLKQVAGRLAANLAIRSDFGNSFATVISAFQAGKSIGFATGSRTANASLVGGHQYVMAGYDANAGTVTVFNPWGLHNGSDKPGLVALSVDSFFGNFVYWTVSA